MNNRDLQSVVLALYYRVDDIDRRWTSITERAIRLAGIGAHHIVLYTSIYEPGRVLVTIGIRHRNSIPELLRSPALFEWFDMDGVDDIPAVFAGELLTKEDLTADDERPDVAIVGAVSTISDVPDLVAEVHSGFDEYAGAGMRKLRMYQAIDDEREVMTLLEFDDLPSAQRWLERRDAAAEWISGAGSSTHPRLFVGRLVQVVTPESTQ